MSILLSAEEVVLWICGYPSCVEVIVIVLWLCAHPSCVEVIEFWLCAYPSCVEVILIERGVVYSKCRVVIPRWRFLGGRSFVDI